MKPVIILGGGGHARVLLDLLRRLQVEILGITDPQRSISEDFFGIRILGEDAVVFHYAAEEIELVNGIGSLPKDTGLRTRLFSRFQQSGYHFVTLIDPTAFVAADVQLDEGVQVLAGVIIQAGTIIAENCIVNSGAIVEHDCRIGRHVHIAPGAVVCGGVEVSDHVHIGSGATLIQGVRIGAESVVGAGSIVTRDIASRQIVFPPRALVQDL
jgi:UDP-perosamine 4-acetyltransferase